MKTENVNRDENLGHTFANGADWVRVDFHLHTRADGEFSYAKEDTGFIRDYVDALEKTGIRAGVITNHNKFDCTEYKFLRKEAGKLGIGLFPGVELSVNDGANGIHTLVVFSDAWLAEGRDHINPFLTVAFEGKTPSQYERENGRSSLSLLETLKKLEGYHKDYFIVFAHVEQNSGLWKELDGGRLQELGRHELFKRRALGFQKVRTHDGAGKERPCRTRVQSWLKDAYPAEVEGSDPKSVDEIGKGEPVYLKLGEVSFESLKFALYDHEHRVRKKTPEKRDAVMLRNVRFAGGALNGLKIPFSTSLNCLIGPRGNGKSAVIECLRHALGFTADSDDTYKSGLVDLMLSPAGKVIVEAVDEHGRDVRIEREKTGLSAMYLDGSYREISPGSILKDILYFGQKDLSTRSQSFDETFLERLLADRLPPYAAEEGNLKESVRQAARQLRETLDATEKIAQLRKEKNEIEVQLQVYSEKGLDKKLEEMTLFDGDRQSVIAWREEIKQLRTDVKESADWESADQAFPALRSKRTEEIRDVLLAAKAKSDEAKRGMETSLSTLQEACNVISEAVLKLEPVQEEMKTEVAALQQTLNEPHLDLEVFRAKKNRFEQLRKILEAGEQRSKTEQTAREILGNAANKLHEFWRERFTEREAEIRRLENELPEEIRIKTSFKSKKNAFEDFLRAVMRGSGIQSTNYESLREAYADGRELYQARAQLETLLSETAASKVRTILLDKLDEFLTFRTPDETTILYNNKPLGDYSLGQRATVILHILMHLQRHPVLIIDQPEDDLDNETLYSHFVRQLLVKKDKIQFIFATHNPNIPVLGDAEQVVVCRKGSEAFSFEHGSIDAHAIQKRIVTVMEGGEDAFQRRKEIYQLWKSSN